MNLFEIIILNSICIIFPLITYLLYCIYQSTLDKKKEEIVFDVALISVFYLLTRFGNLNYSGFPFIVFDIPLIIAYNYNKKFSIGILSILLIFYYNTCFEINLIICTLEYLIYFIIKLILKNKKYIFNNIYIIIKIILFISFIIISPIYEINNSMDIINLFILNIVFYIMVSFTIYLFEKANNILTLHHSIKIIEDEKRIRESLFKITHEIKNPIAVCKGYLDMFDVDNKEHSKKYVPIIKDEIERVLILLQDFLSITKIKINKDIMDLGVLLDDIKNNFEIILKEHKIKLEYVPVDEVYICADYNRLKQVLINVIKNSIEAIGDNGKIKLYTEITDNSIKIYIEDNGVGMDKDELDRINEAFFTTKKNGTGLGIYLSNEIVKLHSGSMKYSSLKSEGTKVILTIPINKKDIKFIS